MSAAQTIGVLGGSGALGSGVARRLVAAGRSVIIGSRDPARAAHAVASLAEIGVGRVDAATYAETAARADSIVVAVPFAAQVEALETIRAHVRGKLVLDCTVPLMPPKVGVVKLPPEGSAAQRAAAALGAEVKLASALHNVSAALLQADGPIDCDVLVFADDTAVRGEAAMLVEVMGLRAIEGGPLANSAAAEALTSVLIQINRRYKAHHAGIRLTGLEGRH